MVAPLALPWRTTARAGPRRRIVCRVRPGRQLQAMSTSGRRASGLGVVVGAPPSPPPTWPTIVSEVGILLAPPAPKDRLFVRLILRFCPVGTVITTGDHPLAAGLSLAQVAVEPATAAPQL